jgi:hypothetical protein
VRLYTITGADWSKRYPLIAEAAASNRLHEIQIQGGVTYPCHRQQAASGGSTITCRKSTLGA